MSDKIKAKDLQYDSTLPPFLQRLHAQKAGRGDVDRHDRQAIRPRKAKIGDDEDDPTIIDESGNVVSKAELEGLNDTAKTSAATVSSATDGTSEADANVSQDQTPVTSRPNEPRPMPRVSDGSVIKKRKLAKAIAVEDDNDILTGDSKPTRTSKATKKKSKTIKLAFEDE